MSSRTLVVILGQLSAAPLTWNNFKENVLEELGADLAVCVPNDSYFDFTNPYYRNARYRWLVPDYRDMADAFDRIHSLLGSSEDWRVICDVRGTWIGRITQSGQPGAASILFVLRWFMLNEILSARLLEIYDRFIITRSDFYYLCPHPPLDFLDPDNLWVPDGEDYGGLTDRHLIVSSEYLVKSCNLIDDLLLRPAEIHEIMVPREDWNIESYLHLHLQRNGLIDKVRRFPYIMFLVKTPEDPAAWPPRRGRFNENLGMIVKYKSELSAAQAFSRSIHSASDWRVFFAAQLVDEAKKDPRWQGLLPDGATPITPPNDTGARSLVASRAHRSRVIRRALIVIPHYFDPSAGSDQHRHDSRRPASAVARAQALEQVIVGLHELFGRHRWGCWTHTLSCERFENPDALDLMIVICTVGEAHLLQRLTCSNKLYTNASFDLDPQWLGLGAHAVIRDNVARGYDWFAYLEDDLLIEDPKFFAKLDYFHRILDERVGTNALLLPMRYETVRDLEAPEKLPLRLYCDYRAGDKPLHDGPAIIVPNELGDITLEPARHPHGGCFFLDRKRAEIFVASPYCASAAKIWTTPLDTAATVAIWSSFRLYKPAANSFGVLDIRHLRPAMLRRFGPRLAPAAGALPVATA